MQQTEIYPTAHFHHTGRYSVIKMWKGVDFNSLNEIYKDYLCIYLENKNTKNIAIWFIFITQDEYKKLVAMITDDDQVQHMSYSWRKACVVSSIYGYKLRERDQLSKC